jgi:DNA-binding transcriptional regulator YhcF (GntR family)
MSNESSGISTGHPGPRKQLESWIDTQLTQNGPGFFFPPEQGLAKRFGLSRATVNAVFKRYHGSGAVCRVRGKGTFVPPLNSDHPVPELKSRSASYHTIVDSVVRGIRSGELKVGTALPAFKFVAAQFKVGLGTVAKAYRELRNSGNATHIGRKYWVGNFNTLIRPGTRKEVCFLIDWDSFPPNGPFELEKYHVLIDKMEKELLAHGFYVRFASQHSLQSLRKQWREKGTMPYGIVFGLVWYWGEPYRQLVDRFKSIIREGKPAQPTCCIILWGGHPPTSKDVDVLNFGNILTIRARTMARFLVDRHFRSAMLFINQSIIPNGDILPCMRIYPELVALSPGFQFHTTVKVPAGKNMRENFFKRIYSVLSADYHLAVFYQQNKPASIEQFEQGITVTESFQHHFKNALDHGLWIFSHAADAEEALRWTRKKNIAVPDRLSLVCFENDYKNVFSNISCCVPDWETTGYLCAHAIINDFPVARTSQGYIRPSASMLERVTTPLK